MSKELYTQAVEKITQLYTQDTAIEEWEGKSYPKEGLYADRMVDMLTLFKPGADDAQLLAARCQHLCRWEVPRSSYPEGKKGYHQWRTYLYTYQADKASEILYEVGYDQETVDRVHKMVSKKGIKSNPDTQLIEDVLCLIFIQFYVEDFASKYADDIPKLFDIIKKTWKKMSPEGHEAALKLPIKPELLETLKEALR